MSNNQEEAVVGGAVAQQAAVTPEAVLALVGAYEAGRKVGESLATEWPFSAQARAEEMENPLEVSKPLRIAFHVGVGVGLKTIRRLPSVADLQLDAAEGKLPGILAQ